MVFVQHDQYDYYALLVADNGKKPRTPPTAADTEPPVIIPVTGKRVTEKQIGFWCSLIRKSGRELTAEMEAAFRLLPCQEGWDVIAKEEKEQEALTPKPAERQR